jgi:hypothetical protein
VQKIIYSNCIIVLCACSPHFFTAQFPVTSLRLSLVLGIYVAVVIQLGHLVPRGYKYGNLALQVGGVSDESKIWP